MKKILFGSGAVAEKNLKIKPDFIVDNNADLIGSTFKGFDVKSPNELIGKVDDYEVIICTTSVGEVINQLEEMGYLIGKNVKVADQISERLQVTELEEKDFKFLVTSGLPSHVNDLSGGGVYEIEIIDDVLNVEKKFSGNVHGIIRDNNEMYFNAQGDGIYQLNMKGDAEKIIDVPKGLRPHGMSIKGDYWYLVSSYEDALVVVDKDGREVDRYSFSSKNETMESAQHHCNDVWLDGEYAYVSMFSVTGNWKRGYFDGGIVEINLSSREQRILRNDLTMPHNICMYENEFRVLNSFKGEILLNNFEVYGVLPGFVRGFDENDQYLFVGESKNRNFSRMKAGRAPVSIDTRITVIDKKGGFSRSIQLPRSISEIHGIINLSG